MRKKVLIFKIVFLISFLGLFLLNIEKLYAVEKICVAQNSVCVSTTGCKTDTTCTAGSCPAGKVLVGDKKCKKLTSNPCSGSINGCCCCFECKACNEIALGDGLTCSDGACPGTGQTCTSTFIGCRCCPDSTNVWCPTPTPTPSPTPSPTPTPTPTPPPATPSPTPWCGVWPYWAPNCTGGPCPLGLECKESLSATSKNGCECLAPPTPTPTPTPTPSPTPTPPCPSGQVPCGTGCCLTGRYCCDSSEVGKTVWGELCCLISKVCCWGYGTSGLIVPVCCDSLYGCCPFGGCNGPGLCSTPSPTPPPPPPPTPPPPPPPTATPTPSPTSTPPSNPCGSIPNCNLGNPCTKPGGGAGTCAVPSVSDTICPCK